MLTRNSRFQSPILYQHYFYVVCYVQVKILPGALFNFIMIKPITTCFYLKFDYSDVDDCMFFPFLIFFFLYLCCLPNPRS